jgi:phosphohistidine phosphatase SixA
LPVKNDEEEAFTQQIRDVGKDTLVVGHLPFMTKLVARLKYQAQWSDRASAAPTSRDTAARHCCRAVGFPTQ